MKLHRLYLGLKNADGLIDPAEFQQWLKTEVTDRFESFTVIHTVGYWRGEEELSAILEVLTDDYHAEIKLVELAQSYNGLFNQQAVLRTSQDRLDVQLVTGRV